MADSKKYNGSTWEHSLRKLGTATDTLTTLPAEVIADGQSATVGLVGNMQQTGTPTPTTPIQPQECGDLETAGTHAGQYKIPLSSASTTTPVYLGEVESTRRIKKVVLTGNEVFSKNADDITDYNYWLPISDNGVTQRVICTHVGYIAGIPSGGTIGVTTRINTHIMYINFGADIMNAQQSGNTKEGLKEYLAAQYSAGTPVCVWYVLATPQTAVVNEPIRKIGDYADIVSGISIPTITGADSFDVLTTLKPSEVELTYTGWHDASAKEWDGSEWQ